MATPKKARVNLSMGEKIKILDRLKDGEARQKIVDETTYAFGQRLRLAGVVSLDGDHGKTLKTHIQARSFYPKTLYPKKLFTRTPPLVPPEPFYFLTTINMFYAKI